MNGKRREVAHYDYRDEKGVLLFQVVRYEPKGFAQRRPDGNGGWVYSLKGVRTVPYRLPQLLAEPKRRVLIVEGEKDADRLIALGELATTNPGGAGKWKPEYAQFFQGRPVAIIADKDGPEKKYAGRKHAEAVARNLFGVASSVRLLEMPGSAKDANAGGMERKGGE